MVYLDTNLLIYLLENHPTHGIAVADTLEQFRKAGLSFVSSTVTITEFFASTSASDATILRDIPHLHFYDVDVDVALRAATLQRENELKIPDSIHLGTALESGATILFTNDKQFLKVASKYIKVETLGSKR